MNNHKPDAAGPAENDVHVEHLERHRGGSKVLDIQDITFRVGVTAVLGPNGAGKTTLLRALATVETNQSDEIRYGEMRLSRRSGRKYRRKLGWLPQPFAPPGHMRVAKYIRYAAWLKEIAGNPPGCQEPRDHLPTRSKRCLTKHESTVNHTQCRPKPLIPCGDILSHVDGFTG